MSVVIETTLGDITVDLYLYERPRACLNFLKLCKIKYYNFNLFHTISRGFIAQTGDPTGSRTGGESIFGVLEGPSKRYFESENEPRIKHTKPGLISFVGDGEKMIGSQFFLTLGEDLTYLDEKHCVFGEVVEGFDVMEVVNEVICDTDDRPYQDVRITHTVVLDDPYADLMGLLVPARSPSPTAERLQGGRIAPDEDVDETEGKSFKEVAELQAEREAKARATILEMVGDIPDAEIAPPENVLFVCKLNPVTTDDDLEIIFSRFGKIKSCEVIRDRKSDDSLQYAFIEFEEQKSCEDAYFKMDNVLIDDRRIHVDFSQSVSKVRWFGKGRITYYDKNDSKNELGKGTYKSENIGGKKKTREDKPQKTAKKREESSEIEQSRKRNYSRGQQKKNSPIRERNHKVEREKRSRSPNKHFHRSLDPRFNSPERRSRERVLKSPNKVRYSRASRSRSKSAEDQRQKRLYNSSGQHSSKYSHRSYSPPLKNHRVEDQKASERFRKSRSSLNQPTLRKEESSRSPKRFNHSSVRSSRERNTYRSSREKLTNSEVKRSSSALREKEVASHTLHKRRKRSNSPEYKAISRSSTKEVINKKHSQEGSRDKEAERSLKMSKTRKTQRDSEADDDNQRRNKKDKKQKKSNTKKKKVETSTDDSSSSDSESEDDRSSKRKSRLKKKKRKCKVSHSDDDTSDTDSSSSSSSSSSDSSSSYRKHKKKKSSSKKRKRK